MGLVQIFGNSFSVRDKLIALGGQWNASACCWEVDESVAQQALALVISAGPWPHYPLARTPKPEPGIRPITEGGEKQSRSRKVNSPPVKIHDQPLTYEPAPPGMVRVTREFLNSGKSARGGWSRKQLALLGVHWPLAHGWKERVLGTLVTAHCAEKFVALRGAHL